MTAADRSKTKLGGHSHHSLPLSAKACSACSSSRVQEAAPPAFRKPRSGSEPSKSNMTPSTATIADPDSLAQPSLKSAQTCVVKCAATQTRLEPATAREARSRLRNRPSAPMSRALQVKRCQGKAPGKDTIAGQSSTLKVSWEVWSTQSVLSAAIVALEPAKVCKGWSSQPRNVPCSSPG